ncbi:hypothetical protein [Evansella cellulosilytica]|uniref:Tetratricopeptide repeat protein n=1 Tax=Evansella cellulosilytica (strain ATCC 21833 / DSM 2522 / FERM P-1141 / JCM 9156 / N-4) TaxID=649639 RepID=E6TXW2_EVAC2|nr:hypothetical protein [Evansella cellulosilytica]ADU31175.1 hypothetical protein Bcell_2924 [Evansella cellulosilytica DSM 2522]
MPQNKAIKKMADRVVEGYEAIHQKNYGRAKQLLEPLRELLHQEDRPNITFLSYLAIAQIGTKDIENFLETFEELEKYDAKNVKEEKLKTRVAELFQELMESLGDTRIGE